MSDYWATDEAYRLTVEQMQATFDRIKARPPYSDRLVIITNCHSADEMYGRLIRKRPWWLPDGLYLVPLKRGSRVA